MNLRPPGYEPDELPNCSTPRYCFLCQPYYYIQSGTENQPFLRRKRDFVKNHRKRRIDEKCFRGLFGGSVTKKRGMTGVDARQTALPARSAPLLKKDGFTGWRNAKSLRVADTQTRQVRPGITSIRGAPAQGGHAPDGRDDRSRRAANRATCAFRPALRI